MVKKGPRIRRSVCGTERLIGRIECNRWGWPGSDKPFMVLRRMISKP